VRRRDLARGALSLVPAMALPLPAWSAGRVAFSGQPTQGGLVFAKAPPGTRAALDGRTLRVTADGRFVFGFGRDQGASATLLLIHPDGARESQALDVKPRRFDVQRIDGLPPKMVEPDENDLERIKLDQQAITKARARDSEEAMWAGPWVWPVTGRISGVYGSQRILNGQPRRPHYGVDVAMPVGTPIVAPAMGIVSVAHGDMYFTGGTIILDHGHGVGSLYAHLSALDVVEGQRVKQGAQIGRVGATGRVTGAHLHWGMTWFAVNVDPVLVVPPMPKS